jgi:hypothetical protein
MNSLEYVKSRLLAWELMTNSDNSIVRVTAHELVSELQAIKWRLEAQDRELNKVKEVVEAVV